MPYELNVNVCHGRHEITSKSNPGNKTHLRCLSCFLEPLLTVPHSTVHHASFFWPCFNNVLPCFLSPDMHTRTHVHNTYMRIHSFILFSHVLDDVWFRHIFPSLASFTPLSLYAVTPPRIYFLCLTLWYFSSEAESSTLLYMMLPSKELRPGCTKVPRTSCHRNRWSKFGRHFWCLFVKSQQSGIYILLHPFSARTAFQAKFKLSFFVAHSGPHLPFTTLSPQNNRSLNTRPTASKLTYVTWYSVTGLLPHDPWLHVCTSMSHKPGV